MRPPYQRPQSTIQANHPSTTAAVSHQAEGTDLRPHRYIDRHSTLLKLLPLGHPNIPWVSAAIDPDAKVETYEDLRSQGAEGVVFKDTNAPYTPDRPASGGPQLKFKFVETASFIVGRPNPGRRSVALELVNDSGTRVPAGNVTIPPNHAIPQKGTVIETRYLYGHAQSGAVYQPVYLGPRDDIPAEDCTVDQLKFKPQPAVQV